jgi:site-specific recombinase XerC
MVVLQATQDIRKVSLWLGHSNLTTTEIYVRADPTEKLEAIGRRAFARASSGRPTNYSRC